ncbi:hypothetical protein BRC91_08085 [Halobacteriales archaeon QS_4_62_28]|nr:MAG: hypothetical protein BRC91_08085 [Halobacteriales archaeon QS_4_62_28]
MYVLRQMVILSLKGCGSAFMKKQPSTCDYRGRTPRITIQCDHRLGSEIAHMINSQGVSTTFCVSWLSKR